LIDRSIEPRLGCGTARLRCEACRSQEKDSRELLP
jgi:hypothetical protein